jgi:hypothetical protein
MYNYLICKILATPSRKNKNNTRGWIKEDAAAAAAGSCQGIGISMNKDNCSEHYDCQMLVAQNFTLLQMYWLQSMQ